MATSAANQIAAMIVGLERAGLSRSQIAEMTHLSRASIWRAVNGEARSPLHETFVKVEQVYGRVVGVDVTRGGRIR